MLIKNKTCEKAGPYQVKISKYISYIKSSSSKKLGNKIKNLIIELQPVTLKDSSYQILHSPGKKFFWIHSVGPVASSESET